MTKFKLSFVLISLIFLAGCASNSKLTKFPDCAGENCFKVAQDTALPSTADVTFPATLQVNNYIFSLQSSPKKILALEPNSVYVVAEDDSIINITVQNKISANEEITIPPGGKLKVADATEIIFTKTPKDKKTTNESDLWLWDRALFSKCSMLKNVNEIHQAKSGRFKLYYFENIKDKISEAYIFDSKNRDEFIYIYGERIKFNKFINTITSVEMKN